MRKKWFAAILILGLIFSLIPISALANENADAIPFDDAVEEGDDIENAEAIPLDDAAEEGDDIEEFAEEGSFPAEEAGGSHTVTFNGNGKGGTLWTLQVDFGDTIEDAIQASDDPDALWALFWDYELKSGGKTYMIEGWYTDQSGTNASYFSPYSEPVYENKILYAQWVEAVTEVNLTLKLPAAGSKTNTVEDGGMWDFANQTNPPVLTTSDKRYEVGIESPSGKPYVYWTEKIYTSYDEAFRPYIGTLNAGRRYAVSADLDSKKGYAFSQDVTVKINGVKIPKDQVMWDWDWITISFWGRFYFDDVPATHSYQKHVYWAVDRGYAAGYTGKKLGLFGVNDNITRGQVMMMLWRAAGKPEPKSSKQTFKDVPTSNNFYKAIQWGVEEGITGGYSGDRAGYFGVNDSCTRGQIATFLWRFAGKPAPEKNKQTFKDVPTSHNFYKAIQWASEQGITAGYSDGTFGINKTCTRGHCVTFLHRQLQNAL